ncbi:hypothetical protein MNBD_NITROSPINAE01-313 [hydrothermal vent metagenome]|uniref:Rubrerythrin diiron-binding domain-containing protein n=1 Tax=hydrothermal vent metagenome TaxID=652676 RepID=A0A3B1C3R5_9ZZZZ
MTEDYRHLEEKLLDVLEEAILEEIASAARYRHALGLARDDEVRAMLEKLVHDEEAHERILKERYHEIKKRLGLKVMKDK